MPTENTTAETRTVLIVEDNQSLADTYELWLEPEYDVRLAHDGVDGLACYDSGVDIVLLDRKLPDRSGQRVIQRMDQCDIDDQKAMLTSTEPGAELTDIPCDEYLTKPVSKTELLDTVLELRLRLQLDDALKRHFALTSKLAALENSDTDVADGAIDRLRREVERSRARVERRLDAFDDFESAYQTL